MRTGFLIIFYVVMYSSEFFAQLKPQQYEVIDLREREIQAPAIYFIVKNHVQFLSEAVIDSVFFVAPCQFEISREGDDKFVIHSKAMPYADYTFINELHMTVLEHSGRKIPISLPVKLVPPVRMEFWFDEKKSSELNADSVIHASGFRCKAKWDYPENISQIQHRFRGVFDVDVLLNGQRVAGTTGWYDAGDMTKNMDLRSFGKDTVLEIVVLEKSLRTLMYDQFPNEFRRPLVELSPVSKKGIRVSVSE